MKLFPTLLAAAAACVISAAPALADQGGVPSNNGPAWGRNGGKGVPGPVAAAGLPFLILAGAAGAYKLIRRRDKSLQQQGEGEQH
jgi:hypothetical protein